MSGVRLSGMTIADQGQVAKRHVGFYVTFKLRSFFSYSLFHNLFLTYRAFFLLFDTVTKSDVFTSLYKVSGVDNMLYLLLEQTLWVVEVNSGVGFFL